MTNSPMAAGCGVTSEKFNCAIDGMRWDLRVQQTVHLLVIVEISTQPIIVPHVVAIRCCFMGRWNGLQAEHKPFCLEKSVESDLPGVYPWLYTEVGTGSSPHRCEIPGKSFRMDTFYSMNTTSMLIGAVLEMIAESSSTAGGSARHHSCPYAFRSVWNDLNRFLKNRLKSGFVPALLQLMQKRHECSLGQFGLHRTLSCSHIWQKRSMR
jgi:hypothetical protein